MQHLYYGHWTVEVAVWPIFV